MRLKVTDARVTYQPALGADCEHGPCWKLLMLKDNAAPWGSVAACGLNHASLSVSFQGTHITVLGLNGSEAPFAHAYIDGHNAGIVRFAVNESDHGQQPRAVFNTPLPQEGSIHTLNISYIARNSFARCIPILGFEISSNEPSRGTSVGGEPAASPQTLAGAYPLRIRSADPGKEVAGTAPRSTITAIAVCAAVILLFPLTCILLLVWERARRRRRGQTVAFKSRLVPLVYGPRQTLGTPEEPTITGPDRKRQVALAAVGTEGDTPIGSARASVTTAVSESRKLEALHAAMRRAGFSVDALLASLNRVSAWQADPRDGAASEHSTSDAPPPTYLS